MKILSVGIKHSLCDLICDVINYCASTLDLAKITVYDNIVMKKLKRKKNLNKQSNIIILHHNINVTRQTYHGFPISSYVRRTHNKHLIYELTFFLCTYVLRKSYLHLLIIQQ